MAITRDRFKLPEDHDSNGSLSDGMKKCRYCSYDEICDLKNDQGEPYDFCSKLNVIVPDSKYIAAGIGDHFKVELHNGHIATSNKHNKIEARWEPSQPVFVSAQTGKGKNYFVENTLFDYVKELCREQKIEKRILVISNRIALRDQIKMRIEKDTLYSMKDEYIDVISYQGLLKDYYRLKHIQSEGLYMFVVCDEAHFFTSDSMFNPDTARILSAITDVFSNAIRIYMTATPFECFDYILEYEYRAYKSSNPNKHCPLGILYHFKRNYNYLDVKYFSHQDELVEIVANSKDKWLIFIDDKNACEELKEKLENADIKGEKPLAGKVMTVDAQSKASDAKIIDAQRKIIDAQEKIVSEPSKADEYSKIIVKQNETIVSQSETADNKYGYMIGNERFPKNVRVVIATSVIDNGINLKDDKKLTNIVVTDISKTKSMQMVGRIRVDSDSDRITLYIRKVPERYIDKRIEDLDHQLEAYYRYDLMEVDPAKNGKEFVDNNLLQGDIEAFKHRFNTSNEKTKYIKPFSKCYALFYLNEIAHSMGKKLKEEYKSIRNEMIETDIDPKVTGQKYLEYQLSWFGKEYDRENDISLIDKNENREELIKFLESSIDKEMFIDKQMREQGDKDEVMIFQTKLTRLIEKAFGSHTKKKAGTPYGLDLLNKTLEKYNLGYIVDSEQVPTSEGKKTRWKVIEANATKEPNSESEPS
jgi:hypothetical protein